MYLLDTDAFSLTSPTSGLTSLEAEAWRHWVRLNETKLHFSVITLFEVRFGLERARSKGATRKAADIARWLTAAETLHKDRLHLVTPAVAHTAAEMLQRAVTAGWAPSTEDALIAATAEVAGLTVVSRNGRHMQVLQVAWIDPLVLAPPSN